MVRNAKLVGQAIIAYLQQKGYPEVSVTCGVLWCGVWCGVVCCGVSVDVVYDYVCMYDSCTVVLE